MSIKTRSSVHHFHFSVGMKRELIANESKKKRKVILPKLKAKAPVMYKSLQENRKRNLITDKNPYENSVNNCEDEDTLGRKIPLPHPPQLHRISLSRKQQL